MTSPTPALSRPDEIGRALKEGVGRVGIWGLGYIGYSSMAHFARAGVRCIGMDVVPEKVKAVNEGHSPIPNMEFWLGFDTAPLARAGLMRATGDHKELLEPDVRVQLVCIPTERGGEPFYDYLRDVIQKLSAHKGVRTAAPPLVIIESTLSPNATDEHVIPLFEAAGLRVGKDVLLAVAPRRDWFITADKNLKELPRVAGGTTPETTEAAIRVLRVVCDVLHAAPDHKHAALVKSIENAYRQVEITLANELSLAYPDLDMREILRLVGTKWNIGTYHPSFGTGGYCIPLAPKYVLMGTEHPERLSIIHAAIQADREQPNRVAAALVRRGVRKVGILGLSYKGDLKVDILSPTLALTEALRKEGIEVKVHDPYYAAEEVKRIAGVETFDFPQGLREFDAVCIVADHMRYKSEPSGSLRESLKGCRLLLDNVAIWRDRDLGSVEYRYAGAAGWLEAS